MAEIAAYYLQSCNYWNRMTSVSTLDRRTSNSQGGGGSGGGSGGGDSRRMIAEWKNSCGDIHAFLEGIIIASGRI
ncbi:Hypothetical predicted protein [Octopus vulgaris]|uniref:Uncharacterized protein n=1 Tax=Octopus vulgaris TaxID=6645 RepID=A0AA36B3Q2_OCTVU|nr:Hypothetical predicted protein [Octopus vulgaris]